LSGGAALLVLLGLAAMLSVAFGAREVGWPEIAAALSGQVETVGDAAVASRLPRTLLAMLAGAALGVSGGVMQGLTRNPLADPGLLGANAGAALAVVIGIAWFGIDETTSYIWTAIAGAAISACAVYAIASLGQGGATPLRLALAGAAITAALSSLATAVVLPRGDIGGLVQSWLVGGVGGATYEQLLPVLPFLVTGFVITLLAARKLNMLALGDDTAAGLGEKVAVARAMSAVGAVLLCGPITAVCGPIGFVGLVVPHACRLLAGGDYRWLLPFSALGGAVLLTLSDVAGRLIAHPSELDVGIVTAFIGAPVFIWIVRNRKVGSL
jgi:iron complex transport system permease protein